MTHDLVEAKQLFYGLDTDANGRLEIEDFKFLEKHPCSFIPLLRGSSSKNSLLGLGICTGAEAVPKGYREKALS